ncbi:MAG TPA: Crp/Fnr family transcriptional regulator [Longimicrobiales bacterium]|nr:Crp/Fnr family transcriptional regulator [Longimicrobiales bacterium]
MSSAQEVAVSGGLNAFLHANPRARESLGRIAVARAYPKGNVLFCHGDTCTSLGYVEAGRVKVALMNDEGREVALEVVRAGHLLGLDALFTQGVHVGTAVTLCDSRIARIPADAFQAWLGEFPGASRGLLGELAAEVRHAYEKIGEIALLPVKRRLLMALLEIARSDGEACRSGQVEFVRPTHQELADLVGSTRVVISRMMKELMEEEDLMAEHGNVIRVHLDDLVLDEFG